MEDVLYAAFFHGDQTVRSGRVFVFLMFCVPSRVNQDLLLSQESALSAIIEHQHF